MVELYFHSLICLHDIVLNELNTGQLEFIYMFDSVKNGRESLKCVGNIDCIPILGSREWGQYLQII
jgi:hypothetical protein